MGEVEQVEPAFNDSDLSADEDWRVVGLCPNASNGFIVFVLLYIGNKIELICLLTRICVFERQTMAPLELKHTEKY